MEHDTGSLKVGDWSVEPTLDRISRGSGVVNLRPQVMELLVYLAGRSGEVVSTNEVLNDLWPGRVVTSGSVYNCIAELRHALAAGADRRNYIETIPKRGYRLIAPVTGLQQTGRASDQADAGAAPPRRNAAVQFVAILAIVLVAGYVVSRILLDRPPRAAVPPDSDLSIAVLPFRDLSPEGDQAYLSDGIAEELLNALAQTRELRVISRTSSFALRDAAALSTPEVAQRLNVTHVLEGAVRRAGNQIRISAQLIDARSDTHLWSQTYDRTLGDIFAIQHEISRQVVDALKIKLLDQAVETSVTDPEVLELVLKGRYELSKRHPENLQQAAGLFEQAIGIDPAYAPAHAGLAKALLLEDMRSGDAAAKPRRAAAVLERALQFDPDNSDALATRGLMLSKSDREAARDYLERAIAQNSSNSDAYRWLGVYYGQSDAARYLEFMRRAYLVDPLVPGLNFHRVVALYHVGRYEDALAAARDWYELNPASPGPYELAGKIHLAAGRLAQAIKSYYGAYRLQPDWGVSSIDIAWLLLCLNEPELAEVWSRQAQRNNADTSDEAAWAMLLEIVLGALRGDQSQALRRLMDIDERHPEWWAELGRAFVLLGDFEHGRQTWERGLVDPGRDMPSNWEAQRLVDYSLALQRTGAAERAAELMTDALALIEAQMSSGMVHYALWNGVQESLQFHAAALYAMRGDTKQALEALQRNSQQESVFCAACLRQWPHFDSLRGDPAFAALLADKEARNAVQSKRLANQDLLLTPEEVLQLHEFSYDPFAE